MKTHRLETQGSVAVVKLDRGVTNAISLELVLELKETLRDVRDDSAHRGLVLTGSNEKFFCIGFDIPELFELEVGEFEVFYKAFNQLCLDLFTLPKPTVAAMEGHATAGGCVLALCCDYRFAVDGRKLLGLNEIKLGVPVPYLADSILRQVVGVRRARTIMETGDFYPSRDALKLGLVDRVLPAGEVLPEAVRQASTLGASPGEGYALIKRNRVEPVEEEVRARLEEREKLFIESWYSPGARERLREAREKF